jgi:hypothetical protein
MVSNLIILHSGSCTIKLVVAVNYISALQTSATVTTSQFHPSLMFASNLGLYPQHFIIFVTYKIALIM